MKPNACIAQPKKGADLSCSLSTIRSVLHVRARTQTHHTNIQSSRQWWLAISSDVRAVGSSPVRTMRVPPMYSSSAAASVNHAAAVAPTHQRYTPRAPEMGSRTIIAGSMRKTEPTNALSVIPPTSASPRNRPNMFMRRQPPHPRVRHVAAARTGAAGGGSFGAAATKEACARSHEAQASAGS